MKLLAIIGSPRPGGNTVYLVEQALGEAAKLGAQTEKIMLSQHQVNPCLGHKNCASFDTCQQSDDASWILEKFYQAAGVILATPVYWYNVPAQMKAFIDRNYFPYKHDQKAKARAVGIIVVAEIEGIEDTLYTLKQFVDDRFDVDGDKRFIVTGYADIPGEVKDNPSLVDEARKLGRLMVASMKAKAGGIERFH